MRSHSESLIEPSIKAVTKRIALRWISHIHEIKESCMNFVAISSVGVDRKYVELLWAKNQKYIDEKMHSIFHLRQSRHAVSDLWSLHSLGRVCFSLDFSFVLSNGVQIGVKSGHIIKFSPCCTSFTINCQCTDSQRKRLLHTIEDTESTFARRSCCVDVEVESIESCTSDKYN